MKKEQIEQKEEVGIAEVSNSASSCYYTITNELRWKLYGYKTATNVPEYNLQQRWQGSDGSEIWKDIEYVD